MVSYTKSFGYFYEVTQGNDAENIYWASTSKPAIQGTQPISFIGDDILQPQCYQINETEYVSYWFAPIETRSIASFLYRRFKPPFFWPEQYRRTGGMSIVFLFDENPDVASAGSGGV